MRKLTAETITLHDVINLLQENYWQRIDSDILPIIIETASCICHAEKVDIKALWGVPVKPIGFWNEYESRYEERETYDLVAWRKQILNLQHKFEDLEKDYPSSQRLLNLLGKGKPPKDLEHYSYFFQRAVVLNNDFKRHPRSDITYGEVLRILNFCCAKSVPIVTSAGELREIAIIIRTAAEELGYYKKLDFIDALPNSNNIDRILSQLNLLQQFFFELGPRGWENEDKVFRKIIGTYWVKPPKE